ncbi:tRNA (guanosine(37)-N1)-methyltransferase TrmD [Rickettsiales bacterium LUAb2]
MIKVFKVTILTLYPEVFTSELLNYSIVKRAKEKNLWQLNVINIRDFAVGNYKKVDDKIYGGGKGLLLKPDVLGKAIDYALLNGASKNLVLLAPTGKQLEQKIVKELSVKDGITIICGHFEGIDYRIIEKYQPLEISMGDFIMSGGEIGAIALVDACVRLLDGAVTSKSSVINESFEDYLLEEPQYTVPKIYDGMEVPEVLCSGNHQKIDEWRSKKRQEITKTKRPDLWQKYEKGIKQ